MAYLTTPLGSGFVTTNGRTIRKLWIRKAVEVNSRGILWGTIPAFTSETEDIGENFRVPGVLAKIGNGLLLNKNPT